MPRFPFRAPFSAHPREDVVLNWERLQLRFPSLSDCKSGLHIARHRTNQCQPPPLNSLSDTSYKWDQYLKKEQAQYLQGLPAIELGPEKRLRTREERDRLDCILRVITARSSGPSPRDLIGLFPNLVASLIPGPPEMFQIETDGNGAVMWRSPLVEVYAPHFGDEPEEPIVETPCQELPVPASDLPHAGSAQRPTLFQPIIFRPSHQSANQGRVITEEARRYFEERGENANSHNYQGTLSLAFIENQQISEADNCSVYIKGISAFATQKNILDRVYEGGIQKFSVQFAVGNFRTQAVSLAFKQPHAAREFRTRCQTGGIWIHGQKIHTIMNRDKVKPLLEQYQSRVLIITMPADYNAQLLVNDIYHYGVVFTLVELNEEIQRDGTKEVALAFGSIIGQSRQVVKAFECMALDSSSHYYACRVRYGDDTCDPSSGAQWNGHFQHLYG